MPRRQPVGAIRQPFNSGSGAYDGLQFICCVVGRHPEIHDVWTFGGDGITCKVHPFARLDVGAFLWDCFGTDYLAENGHKVPMYGQKSMNGSVKWLGVPTFLRNYGPPWDDNILCPSPRWGVRGTYKIWALEIQPASCYRCVDVPWRGAVSARPDYLPRSRKNARATVRRVHDNLLL